MSQKRSLTRKQMMRLRFSDTATITMRITWPISALTG